MIEATNQGLIILKALEIQILILRTSLWLKSNYCQTSNTNHTLVGNKLVDHSDVVGTSTLGAAPPTSSFSTWHLASMDWAKTTARRDEKHLSDVIWCDLYWRFYGTSVKSWWTKADLPPSELLTAFGHGWFHTRNFSITFWIFQEFLIIKPWVKHDPMKKKIIPQIFPVVLLFFMLTTTRQQQPDTWHETDYKYPYVNWILCDILLVTLIICTNLLWRIMVLNSLTVRGITHGFINQNETFWKLIFLLLTLQTSFTLQASFNYHIWYKQLKDQNQSNLIKHGFLVPPWLFS